MKLPALIVNMFSLSNAVGLALNNATIVCSVVKPAGPIIVAILCKESVLVIGPKRSTAHFNSAALLLSTARVRMQSKTRYFLKCFFTIMLFRKVFFRPVTRLYTVFCACLFKNIIKMTFDSVVAQVQEFRNCQVGDALIKFC